MLVNKRIGKVLQLIFVLVAIGSVYFIVESVRSNNDYTNLSVSQYRDYLKSHIDTNNDNGEGLNKEDRPVDEKLQKFYSSVFQNIIDHSPSGKCRRVYKDACKLTRDVGNRPDDYENWFKLSYDELINCLELDHGELENLSSSHASFIDQLNKLVLPRDSYKGNGIVMVGGGKFSLMAFLVIKTLRNLGTTLPVEVFIPPNDEGETEFCNKLLPKFNSKCVYISDILPQQMIEKFEFKGYQFKSIAIIASSFENLLLLDADNFPIKPLDDIFDAEPYRSTGLVMWPDFWRRTTQPLYYKIAGRTIDFKTRVRNSIDDLTPPHIYTKNLMNLKDVPFHDLLGTIPDVSTESGQLLINKSKHLATVLLALYYNVNGPTWYYPIFSQKAAGEGDKETFIAAANFYDLPFYQVKTNVGVDGYHLPNDKGYRGVAMLQHDFIQDYAKYMEANTKISQKYAKVGLNYDPEYTVENFYKEYFQDDEINNEVDIMFIHSNLPKFDPYNLWQDEDLIVDGQHIRSFTNLKRLKNYDIELENFKIFDDILCQENKKPLFKYLEDKMNTNDFRHMCQYIGRRLDFLNESHNAAIGKTDK